MKFFEIIKGCFKPKTFFSTLPDESIGQPIKYYSIWTGIYAILSIPLLVLGLFIISAMPYLGIEINTALLPLIYIATLLAAYVFYLVMYFIGAGIFHLILKLTGAKDTFSKTFQIFIYSFTPNALYALIGIPIAIASVIPFIGFFISLLSLPLSLGVLGYSLFLRVYGFAKAHNISYMRAAIPDIVAFVVFSVLIVIAIIISVASSSYPGVVY